MAGSTVLYDYAATDMVMRNMALCGLRQLEFQGRAIAAVLRLNEAYVRRCITRQSATGRRRW